MIDYSGKIEFHQFMKLERLHGRDRAYDIVTEIHNRLDKLGYFHHSREKNKDDIKLKSYELYHQILDEWEDDDIPYKD